MSALEEHIEQIAERVATRKVAEAIAALSPDDGNFISVKHASLRYDIPEDTLRKWMRQRRLKKYTIKGCVRLKVSELEENC